MNTVLQYQTCIVTVITCAGQAIEEVATRSSATSMLRKPERGEEGRYRQQSYEGGGE